MTWKHRSIAVAELDGDEWDSNDQLRRDWLAAYSASFISIAVSRGWKQADAETWPTEIGDEAFIESWRQDCDPQQSLADVIACEQEAEP
jgi:hypothetical protein